MARFHSFFVILSVALFIGTVFGGGRGKQVSIKRGIAYASAPAPISYYAQPAQHQQQPNGYAVAPQSAYNQPQYQQYQQYQPALLKQGNGGGRHIATPVAYHQATGAYAAGAPKAQLVQAYAQPASQQNALVGGGYAAIGLGQIPVASGYATGPQNYQHSVPAAAIRNVEIVGITKTITPVVTKTITRQTHSEPAVSLGHVQGYNTAHVGHARVAPVQFNTVYTSYSNPTVGVNGPVTYAGSVGGVDGNGYAVAPQSAYNQPQYQQYQQYQPALLKQGYGGQIAPAVGGLAYETLGVELASSAALPLSYERFGLENAIGISAPPKFLDVRAGSPVYSQKAKGGYY